MVKASFKKTVDMLIEQRKSALISKGENLKITKLLVDVYGTNKK